MMHWYKYHIGDYRKDTSHLSPIEHYIYRSLIDWCYLDECGIPKKTHLVLRRLSLENQHEPSLRNVLDDFFEERDEEWIHPRINREVKAYKLRNETNSENGKKGGRPKKQRVSGGNKPKKTHSVSIGNRTETEQEPSLVKPLTINHKPRTKNQEPRKDLSGKPDNSECIQILEYLNFKTGKKFQAVDSNCKPIAQRISETSVHDAHMVVDNRVERWLNDNKMHEYLRPSTLFNKTKYHDYLGEAKAEPALDGIDQWLNDNQHGVVIDGDFTNEH